VADRQTVLTPLPVPSDRLWLDPAAVGRNLAPRFSTVTSVGGAVEKVAAANPARWAVGFIILTPGGFNARVYPDASAAATAGVELASSRLDWFDLPRYGPLVSFDWWAVCSPGTILSVVEIIRTTRGY